MCVKNVYNTEPMCAAHLAGILEIEHLCFSDPWPQDSFLYELHNPIAFYRVAVEEGAVLGYAGMQTILDEGYITNVAVHPNARRRGIGKRLMTELLAEGKRRGLGFLTLEVRESNTPAKALYESLGFLPAGTRPNYYTKPRENAILYTLYYKS